MSISKKFKLYVEDNWNKCDMVAISLFVVGVVCRQEKLLHLLLQLKAKPPTGGRVNGSVSAGW